MQLMQNIDHVNVQYGIVLSMISLFIDKLDSIKVATNECV